ncbi:MAG: glycosyltransferase [Pseudomonadota bacterium]
MVQLDVPVNFVIPDKLLWDEIKNDQLDLITDEVLSQRCNHGLLNWIAIPYVYLRRRGLDVTYATKPIPNAINLYKANALGIKERALDVFLVAARADGHDPKIANYVIEQNNLNAGKETVSWIPHPPHPGLIKRDISRGTRLERLGYMGSVINLYKGFKSDEFLGELDAMGVDLNINLRNPTDSDKLTMHDYSKTDAVLAVRNLTNLDIVTKPASKLQNAWMAGVPAILGPEPGYRELRKSELDYIEINSPEDAIAAIRRLKDNPDLYRQMIENGLERGKDFTVDKYVGRLLDALNGPIADAFRRWQSRGAPYRAIRLVRTAFEERASRNEAILNRDRGERPFGPN